MTILTKEIMDAAKSTLGGYSNAQLALIGLKLPVMPAWRRSVVGKEFPDEALREFVALKDKHHTPASLKSGMANKIRRAAERAAIKGVPK